MALTERQSIGGGFMATQNLTSGKGDVPTAWSPKTRQLSDELAQLIAMWPASAGRVVRVLYSPPDWDDRPRAVSMPGGGRIKTGNFPQDDTHEIVLTTWEGRRHTIAVTAPAPKQRQS